MHPRTIQPGNIPGSIPTTAGKIQQADGFPGGIFNRSGQPMVFIAAFHDSIIQSLPLKNAGVDIRTGSPRIQRQQ